MPVSNWRPSPYERDVITTTPIRQFKKIVLLSLKYIIFESILELGLWPLFLVHFCILLCDRGIISILNDLNRELLN